VHPGQLPSGHRDVLAKLAVDEVELLIDPIASLAHVAHQDRPGRVVTREPHEPTLAPVEVKHGDARTGSQIALRAAEVDRSIPAVVVGVGSEDEGDGSIGQQRATATSSPRVPAGCRRPKLVENGR
jgi:hypothetical protein